MDRKGYISIMVSTLKGIGYYKDIEFYKNIDNLVLIRNSYPAGLEVIHKAFGINVDTIMDILRDSIKSFKIYHSSYMTLLYNSRSEELISLIEFTITDTDTINNDNLVKAYKSVLKKLNKNSKFLKFDIVNFNKKDKKKTNNNDGESNDFWSYNKKYSVSSYYGIAYTKSSDGYDVVFMYKTSLLLDEFFELLEVNRISGIPFELTYVSKIKKDKNNEYTITVRIERNKYDGFSVNEEIRKKGFGEIGSVKMSVLNSINNNAIIIRFVSYDVDKVNKLLNKSIQNKSKNKGKTLIDQFEELTISKDNSTLYKKAKQLFLTVLENMITNCIHALFTPNFLNSYVKLKREANMYDFLIS